MIEQRPEIVGTGLLLAIVWNIPVSATVARLGPTTATVARLDSSDPTQLLRSQTYTTPETSVSMAVIRSLFEAELPDFREPGWDGYDALPANPETIPWAVTIATRRPLERLGTPYCSFDQEGEAILEWESSPERALTLIVGPAGEFSYAARVDGESFTGKEASCDPLSDRIAQIATRLTANDIRG